MGGFLLLPEDEVLLVEHLVGDEGLALLASDDLRYGPRVLERLPGPQPLPPPAKPLQQSPEPRTFIFWAQALGQLPSGGTLDYAGSPIIRWARAHWHENGALCPGLLQAQASKTREQPPDLLRLHSRLKRWMKARSTRLNPFEHAPAEVRERQPANLRDYATWAFPAAADWVRQGGEVWPWNA